MTPLEKPKSRRSFLNTILSSSVAALFVSVVYPVIRYLIPPKDTAHIANSVVAATVNELKPNSGKIFRFGRRPAILIKTAQGELRAFTAVCTHLDCTVQYRDDIEHIWCACHNGHYDLYGRNIQGPPPRPLTQFAVAVQGDKVIVSREI